MPRILGGGKYAHKIDVATFTKSGNYNPGASGYSGWYCKGCGRSVTSKPGSMGYRHGDFQVYPRGDIPG